MAFSTPVKSVARLAIAFCFSDALSPCETRSKYFLPAFCSAARVGSSMSADVKQVCDSPNGANVNASTAISSKRGENAVDCFIGPWSLHPQHLIPIPRCDLDALICYLAEREIDNSKCTSDPSGVNMFRVYGAYCTGFTHVVPSHWIPIFEGNANGRLDHSRYHRGDRILPGCHVQPAGPVASAHGFCLV